MSTHADQEQKEFFDWLETEPELVKLLAENRFVINSVYRSYFESGLGLPADKAAIKVKNAVKLGFEVSVKTGRGILRAFVDPKLALIDLYFEVLGKQIGVELTKFDDYGKILSNASGKQKEVAEYLCSLYLMNFVPKLQQELRGTMAEVSQLAKIEIIKQSGSDMSLRELIEALGKQTEKRRKREAGVSPGGARPRKGFRWDKEKNVAFYEMVNQTPIKNGKTIWEFACSFLIEEGFESDNVQWLLNRPEFEKIDHGLFGEARRKWRRHEERSDITDDEDKPRFFEYRQALIILGFPDTFTFASLETYFYKGKKGL